MPRPKKFNYDSNDFYDEILALAMQGLNDAEIADALSDRFGVSLSPAVFCTMKNGNYDKWNEKENRIRSERLAKVLERGRRKINAIVEGAWLKSGLGGKKIKTKTTIYSKYRCKCKGTDKSCKKCHGTGWVVSKELATVEETEQELAPNPQVLATWKYHHDPDWRKIEQKQKEDESVSNAPPVVNVQVVTKDESLLNLQDKMVSLKKDEKADEDTV